jgi:hypothetical protein
VAVVTRDGIKQNAILMAVGVMAGHLPMIDARGGAIEDRHALARLPGWVAIPPTLNEIEFRFQQTDQV